MHPKLTLAAAAVALLASCLCTSPRDKTEKPVAEVPTAALSAYYTPTGSGTFRADVNVDAGTCAELPADATADVGGVPLDAQEGADCACNGSRFVVSGAEMPAVTEGTFRVADASGEMTATVPDLFVEPTVALRAPATALEVGTRVYLDLLPANGTMTDVTVSFTPYFTYTAAFTFRSSDGSLGHDGAGYYVDVPNVAPGDGELTVATQAKLATSSCVGAASCEVIASATRRLATAVVGP